MGEMQVVYGWHGGLVDATEADKQLNEAAKWRMLDICKRGSYSGNTAMLDNWKTNEPIAQEYFDLHVRSNGKLGWSEKDLQTCVQKGWLPDHAVQRIIFRGTIHRK